MKRYDFFLIIVTIIILLAIGAISLGGSAYAWYASGSGAEWKISAAYEIYVEAMNSLSFPFFVGLILALALCIPKRIVARSRLILTTTAMFLTAILVGAATNPDYGLGAIVLFSIAIQSAVLGLTLFGRKSLHYQTTGFWSQIGSALLHLGLVAFLFDAMLLVNGTIWHSVTFWSATATITAGMILAFYDKELTKLIKQRQAT